MEIKKTPIASKDMFRNPPHFLTSPAKAEITDAVKRISKLYKSEKSGLNSAFISVAFTNASTFVSSRGPSIKTS